MKLIKKIKKAYKKFIESIVIRNEISRRIISSTDEVVDVNFDKWTLQDLKFKVMKHDVIDIVSFGKRKIAIINNNAISELYTGLNFNSPKERISVISNIIISCIHDASL